MIVKTIRAAKKYDYHLIDVTQNDLLNGVMLEHFMHNSTIASSNNKNFLRLGWLANSKWVIISISVHIQ